MLTAGSWLNDESFETGGALARMIRPDERALAVAADDVVNVGGQLSPGDYVDVLLFLRMDTNNLQQSAQVVVPALRVLGVGDQLGLMNDGQPANPARSTEERLKQEQQRASARTVFACRPRTPLEPPDARGSGRGFAPGRAQRRGKKRLNQYWAGNRDSKASLASANRELVQFSQLALDGTPKPATGGAAPRKTSVEVIRGNEVTQQTP